MRHRLKSLARLGAPPRPVVPIEVAGLTLDGLVDTGAEGCLMAEEVARFAGIDIDTAAKTSTVRAVAGRGLPARLCAVPLTFEGTTWTTDVWFCAGWVWEHQLLGMSGFIDRFVLTLNSPAGWVELT